MNNFMIKAQINTQEKKYLVPSKNSQNNHQISRVDLDKNSQFKAQNEDQIRKEFQESQITIFQNQRNQKNKIKSLVDLDQLSQNQKEDQFRKQQQESLDTISQIQVNEKDIETSYEQTQVNLQDSQYTIRCILSMQIENFTQGDKKSFKRIKNLKSAAYTEKEYGKILFQQINSELDNLQNEYKSEQVALEHLSTQ
ncbi:hypothetical protein ABPG72_005026 [Tetrahymena utriculariae]